MSQNMLPVMLEDMTLYAYAALTSRMLGVPNGKQVSRILFDSPSAGLRHDFPSHLKNYCKRTKYIFGNPQSVANNATVLPYFLRFKPEHLHTKAILLMCGPSVEALKFHLGLPPGPTGSTMPLKYCRDCASADIDAYGFSYWHRVHQLPGVLLCPMHTSELLQSNVRLNGRGRSGLFLPEDLEIQKSIHELRSGREKFQLERIAKLSQAALNIELPVPYSPLALRATYFHGLKQQGLLSSFGRIRASEFLNRFRKHYELISCHAPFNGMLGSSNIEGMLRLLRKPRGSFHTLSHLLMIEFLFGDWALFSNVYKWERQLDLPFEDQSAGNNAPSLRTLPSIDYGLLLRLESLASRYKNQEGSLSSLAREAGIDINTAIRWLGKLGLVVIPRRPKCVTAEMKKIVIESLSDGEPLINIVRSTGLSRATIDRICNDHPDLPSTWRMANHEWKRKHERLKLMRVIRDEPQITLKLLRMKKGSGYSWLSRHDKEWLKDTIPKTQQPRPTRVFPTRPRVDWLARDHECLKALDIIEASLTFESWERLQPKAILRRLPEMSFSPRLECLPKSKAKIETLLTAERIRRNSG